MLWILNLYSRDEHLFMQLLLKKLNFLQTFMYETSI